MLQLIAADVVGPGEISDIDDISLEQLVEWPSRIVTEPQRRYRPFLQRKECVRDKSLPPQFLIDLAESRLPFIEIDELHLQLHRCHVSQRRCPAVERSQFAALNVHLQEIDRVESKLV